MKGKRRKSLSVESQRSKASNGRRHSVMADGHDFPAADVSALKTVANSTTILSGMDGNLTESRRNSKQSIENVNETEDDKSATENDAEGSDAENNENGNETGKYDGRRHTLALDGGDLTAELTNPGKGQKRTEGAVGRRNTVAAVGQDLVKAGFNRKRRRSSISRHPSIPEEKGPHIKASLSAKSRLRAVAKLVNSIGQMHAVEPKFFQEPSHAPEDPQTIIRNKTYDVVKNTLGLLFQDDQLRLGVDNAYPLLKTIGLNPQSERVVDLVREASIENYGEIKPEEFEFVVLGLVHEQDVELWERRMEGKQHLHHEMAAAKAKAEADKLRVVQERLKAGFVVSETELKEEAEREEMMQKKEKDIKEKMEKEDELFDNMKMAFRFIDHDGDGVISSADLYTLMMGLGEMLTDDELFSILNMVDLDCDGKVTYDDFRKFLLPQCGDETLITAPHLLTQSLLNQATEPAFTKATEDSKTNVILASDTRDIVQGSINIPFGTDQEPKSLDTSAIVEDTNTDISAEEGLVNAKPETTWSAEEKSH